MSVHRATSNIATPRRLGRKDYAVDTVAMATALLGARLVRTDDAGNRLAGTIVETEAYVGVEDKACKTYQGRRTANNESMYAQPGTAYVYFTYGMHFCMNVVCGALDEPVAVLLRALEPTEGIEIMRRNRTNPRRKSPLLDTDLCSGPAKLCQALKIDKSFDCLDLCADSRLFIEPSPTGHVARTQITRAPRIGIASAGDWVDRPLRFYLTNSRHISRK